MNLPLLHLEPEFIRYDRHARKCTFNRVPLLAHADGIMFLCPRCFVANMMSAKGTHRVICWRPNVPPEFTPGPGRWDLVGTGMHDLSLRAGSSSVKLAGGCEWHGFVTNGQVTDA